MIVHTLVQCKMAKCQVVWYHVKNNLCKDDFRMFMKKSYGSIRKHSLKFLNFATSPEDLETRENDCGEQFLSGVRDDLLEISTVHGIRRIFGRTSKKIERLLLLFGFIFAIYFFALVNWNIAYIIRYKPFQTYISNLHLPIFKIPFPEVIICNINRLNWQRYEEAKLKFLRPIHYNTRHEMVFRETVNGFDTLQFGAFENFKNISINYERKLLRDLNYINFTHVIEFMSWRCHEIFSHCSWRNTSFDCCELFSPRKSERGYCLAFNTIEGKEGQRKLRSDPFYPWHTMDSGPLNGLGVRIHIREEFHSPLTDVDEDKGVSVMLVEPGVYSYLQYRILTNARAVIGISGFLHIRGNSTRIYSPDVRKCVFDDETSSVFYKTLPDHPYMYENCQAQCEQEYLMKYCNCSIDTFFPTGSFPVCRLVDLPCLYEHNDDLQYFEEVGEREYVEFDRAGMSCPCFGSCRSLYYFYEYSIHQEPRLDVDPNNTYIDLQVYFLWKTIIVYKTNASYPLIDFMASIGGMAGVCIGCSLIGIIELLYFLVLSIPKQVWLCFRKPQRLRVKRESLKTRLILVKEHLAQ